MGRGLVMKTLILALCLVLMLSASTASASIVTFTDRSTWDAAVGSFVTEPFNATGLQSFTGVVTVNGSIGPAPTGGDCFPSPCALSGSVWNDVVVPGGASTTFSFLPGPLIGAGADWDTSPNGEGSGLALTINLNAGGSLFVAQIGPINGTFFGWTSTSPFDSFTIQGGTNPGIETFAMDNLSFATGFAAVPTPATLLLLGSGLAGLGGIAWKRHRRK